MGSFLDKPKTEKHNEHGDGNGLRFAVSSMQGWRCEMEDAHHAKTGLANNMDLWSYFAVFDGHAGVKVSEYCAKHLLDSIVETEEFKFGNYVDGIRTGFLKLDESMRELPEFASGMDKSGTTAVCAFISDQSIYIANCGDSRALLCRNGEPLFATRDHKPVLPDEKERIRNAGGSVMIQRVNGSLAVSRALGDYEFKNLKEKSQCEQLVSPEPDTIHHPRDGSDEFVVLACDGIWDVMTNDEVCSFVHSRLKVTTDLEDITNQVIDTCLYKGSRDNMSIIIIALPGCPKPTPEAVKAEEELEANIFQIIEDYQKSEHVFDYAGLLQLISKQKIEGLPPGGGLESKCSYIAEIFKKLWPDLADQCEPGNYFYFR